MKVGREPRHLQLADLTRLARVRYVDGEEGVHDAIRHQVSAILQEARGIELLTGGQPGDEAHLLQPSPLRLKDVDAVRDRPQEPLGGGHAQAALVLAQRELVQDAARHAARAHVADAEGIGGRVELMDVGMLLIGPRSRPPVVAHGHVEGLPRGVDLVRRAQEGSEQDTRVRAGQVQCGDRGEPECRRRRGGMEGGAIGLQGPWPPVHDLHARRQPVVERRRLDDARVAAAEPLVRSAKRLPIVCVGVQVVRQLRTPEPAGGHDPHGRADPPRAHVSALQVQLVGDAGIGPAHV